MFTLKGKTSTLSFYAKQTFLENCFQGVCAKNNGIIVIFLLNNAIIIYFLKLYVF